VAAGTGVGYDDPTFGQARRDGVCEVLKEIATLIKLDQTNTTPDILFAITPDDMPSNALASASAYYGYYINPAGPDNGSLYKHITTGQDPTSTVGSFDALVNTNFQVQWSVDSQLDANTYDFHTVMWHEVLHALGFMSSLPAVIGSSGSSIDHNTFSEHLYEVEPTSSSNRYLSFAQELSPVLQAPNGSPSAWFVNNTSMYQGRKNIVGAPLDGAHPLFTPLAWQQGSSISHFDMERAPGIEYVMNPSIGAGIDRDIHEHEEEVLCHLGYQVLGLAGCEAQSPVANADIITTSPSGTTLCMSVLDNDVSFSGGNLSIESLGIIDLPSTVQMHFDHQTTNCSGEYAMTNINPVGAKSIFFNNPNLLPFTLKYKVKDSITNRISLPAFIMFVNLPCTSDPYEYVCNGDFEMGVMPGFEWTGGGNALFSQGGVPHWNDALPSSDLVKKTNDGYGLPTTFGNGQTLDMVDEGIYAAHMIHAPGAPGTSEKITTQLKAPLTINSSYVMSYDVMIYNMFFNASTALTSLVMQGAFSTQNTYFDSSLPYAFNPPNLNATFFLDQEVDLFTGTGIVPWTHVEQTFVADEAFEFFYITTPNITEYINQVLLIHVDNVSIRLLDENSISGKTYNDTNLNGIQESGELGLGGVTVGLFNASNSIVPIQTTTTSSQPNQLGNYIFNSLSSLPNGYFVAIVPEISYSMITQPIENNALAGYVHAIQVPFANGGNVGGQNFGIVLNGQGPDLVITDDITWKTENDSNFGNAPVMLGSQTPGVNDSYVDFKVAVKNIGGSDAVLPTDDELMDFQLFKITGLVSEPQITLENGFQDSPVTIAPGGIHYIYLRALGKPNTLREFIGTFAIRVEVDTANAVFETNETNNVSPPKPFVVIPVP
jgi:hypothetical protein